jgi:hypothetical protein
MKIIIQIKIEKSNLRCIRSVSKVFAASLTKRYDKLNRYIGVTNIIKDEARASDSKPALAVLKVAGNKKAITKEGKNMTTNRSLKKYPNPKKVWFP